MLLHHPIALSEPDSARELSAELAERLPVTVPEHEQVHPRLADRPFAEVQTADAREVARELLRRHLTRLAVEPDRALARSAVVHAVHQVPRDAVSVVRAPDACRPSPCGVPGVVAGGLVDEAVVAIELEAPAAGRHAPAHEDRSRLASPDVRAPVWGDDLHAAGLVELKVEHSAHARAAGGELHAARPLDERAVGERNRPPPLPDAAHARVGDTQHQLRPVDAHVVPPLQRPPGVHEGHPSGRDSKVEPAYGRAARWERVHRRAGYPPGTLPRLTDQSIAWRGEERARGSMLAAAVQLQCTTDMEANLASAERLTRAAVTDGAELVVLPERLDIRGAAKDYRAGAEPLDGRPVSWARELAAELGIDLVAGSVAERREGRERVSNTSVHLGPDGEIRAVYRKIHMFDVEVGGVDYRESEHSEPSRDIVVSETAHSIGLGLTVCYDLRFPELYRILALRGARIVTVPANFTRVTGEAHWEVLLRARAIEDQVFVIAPGQGNRPGPRGRRARDRRRARPRAPGRGPREAAEPREQGRVRLPVAGESDRLMATAPKSAPDKRRMILDAAVRVFARQGFHHCRVSDVADEAGVAYGLVYHYFDSKEEILNTLLLERWGVMLDAIGEIDARDIPSRDKLRSVAGFIIDSYRHDPDLMKVIIVEVTRAANSFGALHLQEIRKAYEGIAAIVEAARADGSFKSDIPSEFAAMCFYGAIEQLLTSWIFEVLPRTDAEFERAKELMWAGLLAGVGALTTIVANRIAEKIWLRVFKEDPPTG